jgi:hypothetical protein
VTEVVLMLRYARRGLPEDAKPRETVPALTY